MLAAPLSIPPVDFSTPVQALSARMEAAAEALLRVRHEVVSALDHQVSEIQQLHRALASPPPPMVIVEDTAAAQSLVQAVQPTATSERFALFEQAPVPVSPAGLPTGMKATGADMEQSPSSPVVVQEMECVMTEATLDPFLERATLEELNDALASAFAMVSARSGR